MTSTSSADSPLFSGREFDIIVGVNLSRSTTLSPVLTDSKEDFASPVRFKLATLFLSIARRFPEFNNPI
jgi:hypothetical protein